MDEELQRRLNRAAQDKLSPEAIDAMVQAYRAEKAQNPATTEPKHLIDLGRDEHEVRVASWQKSSDEGWQHTKDHPVQTAAEVAAMAALPVGLGVAKAYGTPVIQAGARMATSLLENPMVTGAAGAYEGWRRGGGLPGILAGAITGGTLGKWMKGRNGAATAVPEPKITMPKASVGQGGVVAPSTETAMTSGAPAPSGPVPFVMSRPVEPPMPTMRTGTGFTGEPPSGPTSPQGNGFSASVKADAPAPTPTTPRPSRTGTGSASGAPAGPTNTKGNGFSMNVEDKPKAPAAATTAAAADTTKTTPATEQPAPTKPHSTSKDVWNKLSNTDKEVFTREIRAGKTDAEAEATMLAERKVRATQKYEAARDAAAARNGGGAK